MINFIDNLWKSPKDNYPKAGMVLVMQNKIQNTIVFSRSFFSLDLKKQRHKIPPDKNHRLHGQGERGCKI
jgi:hypothetical protein